VIVKGVLRHLAKAFAHPLQFREGGDKADQKNGGQYPGSERRMALNYHYVHGSSNIQQRDAVYTNSLNRASGLSRSVCAMLPRGVVFLVRAAHYNLEHIVGQGALQRLRFIPWRARIHRSRSSSVIRMTGIALGWIGSTMAFGVVVRKPWTRCGPRIGLVCRPPP
jgi:hypothetical protein